MRTQQDALRQERQRLLTTLSSSLDAYEILNATVQHLVELINVDYGGVLMLERGGDLPPLREVHW